MDDKLTAKTAKFTSLENLYVYGMYKALPHSIQFIRIVVAIAVCNTVCY